MDRKIWLLLSLAVRVADKRVPQIGRHCKFDDRLIVRMFLWAAFHDCAPLWACDRTHYNTLFRPRQLPSTSQFYRRLNMPRTMALLRAVNDYLTEHDAPTQLLFFDGKPLPVGDFSRDPDAHDGYGAGRMQRGYKLHACGSDDGKILDFQVLPLNVGEPNTARQLLSRIPNNSLVLADANYDSNPLYAAVATRDAQLLTRLKGQAWSTGRLSQMSLARRTALAWWRELPQMCEALLQRRDTIERIFSALTCTSHGLTVLPSWVRRLPRVQRWVTAKIAIYHARLRCRKENAA
jgi:hypothetical protein